MKVPESIEKMLSSGHTDTIRLGLFLAVDFFDDVDDFCTYLTKLYYTIVDNGQRGNANELSFTANWRGYYKENKQYGKNTQTTTISG